MFERRIARLTSLVENAEFEGGSAFGDLRDCILDLYKQRPKLWSAMPPSEQTDLVRHIEGIAKQVLEKVVLVIAQEDDLTIEGTLLPAFNVKGESVEVKIKLDHVLADDLPDIYRLTGHKVVIVDASSKRFMSARREHNLGKDQPDLPFASSAPSAPREIVSPTPAEHPADDSDLAGEDDDGDELPEGEGAEPEADPVLDGDAWGVFNTDRGEWLIDEAGGDDGWTNSADDAGRWPHDEAKVLAADFADGGDSVVARQLAEKPKAD